MQLVFIKNNYIFSFLKFRLSWYCYGPPEGTGRPEFFNIAMLHLKQVRAPPRELTEEELVKHIETQSKSVRRAQRKNGDEGVTEKDSDDVGNNSTVSTNTIRLNREIQIPQQSVLTLMDQALNAKTDLLEMLKRTNAITPEETASINAEIVMLLRKKADFAMKEIEQRMNMY